MQALGGMHLLINEATGFDIEKRTRAIGGKSIDDQVVGGVATGIDTGKHPYFAVGNLC